MDSQERVSFGSHYNFPKKLLRVANDDTIIRWTDDGAGLVVQETQFEENVMSMYPGFVQVETFHNLRRLFRDYSFKFRILGRSPLTGRTVEFRHSNFTKDNTDGLLFVKKRPRFDRSKLKSLKPLATSSPKHYKRKYTKRNLSVTFDNNINWYDESENADDLEMDLSDVDSTLNFTLREQSIGTRARSKQLQSKLSTARHSSSLPNSSPLVACCGSHCVSPVNPKASQDINWNYNSYSGAQIGMWSGKVTRQETRHNHHDHNPPRKRAYNVDNLRLLQHFAKNELTESEFWEVLTRHVGGSCNGLSWEAIKDELDKLILPELSPLHFKGYYYDVPLSEM